MFCCCCQCWWSESGWPSTFLALDATWLSNLILLTPHLINDGKLLHRQQCARQHKSGWRVWNRLNNMRVEIGCSMTLCAMSETLDMSLILSDRHIQSKPVLHWTWKIFRLWSYLGILTRLNTIERIVSLGMTSLSRQEKGHTLQSVCRVNTSLGFPNALSLMTSARLRNETGRRSDWLCRGAGRKSHMIQPLRRYNQLLQYSSKNDAIGASSV